MAAGPVNMLFLLLRRTTPAGGAGDQADGVLLDRYVARRDGAAFEALLARHGPMVWGVCRRILGSEADAEDAFQATFLVLARKAGSVRSAGALAGWLHEVARATAQKARHAARRRRLAERAAAAVPVAPAADGDCGEMRVIDEELARLPDRYRTPIVVCDLEGRTIADAAARLGWPAGTVATRLRRGRERLAARLARRGVTLPAGLTVTAAAVPEALRAATLRVAGAGIGGYAAGAVPAGVAVLARGASRTMFLLKLKAAAAVAAALACVVFGVPLLRPGDASGGTEPAGRPAGPAGPADLTGTWQGGKWGTVVLAPDGDGGFRGTYSNTFGKDVGRLRVAWSARSGRYEGTWAEGKFRFGRLSLRPPAGNAVRGSFATDPGCLVNPGTPDLSDLSWERADPSGGPPRGQKAGQDTGRVLWDRANQPGGPTTPPPGGADGGNAGQTPAAAPIRLEGVRLDAVDVKNHAVTFRLTAERLPDQVGVKPPAAEDDQRPATLSWVPVARNAEIVLKVRGRNWPILAMTGYPMSLAEFGKEFGVRKAGMLASVELRADGDRLVVTKIEGWSEE